jgi:hypothetical protein
MFGIKKVASVDGVGPSHRDGVERLIEAARPVFETALISAAAFVCAHAGWSVLAPSPARATDTSSDSEARVETAPAVLVRSPFDMGAAPAQNGGAAGAFAASIGLHAVRVSTDPSRSSAFLIMSDGVQKAFLQGEIVGEGVTLKDVSGDHVILSYAGGERRIALTPPVVSYAAAMLGRAATDAGQAQ